MKPSHAKAQFAFLSRLVALCAVLLVGCNGAARVSVISTEVRKLAEDEALQREIHPDRCHWFVDDKNRLCIAMEGESDAILGDLGHKSMAMSLVLGEPLESGSREYKLDRRSLRMIATTGLGHFRWASLGGVVFIRRDAGHSSLRGRFRIAAKQQNFFIATGWRGDLRTLLLGEFTATRDDAISKQIVDRTEGEGMKREP